MAEGNGSKFLGGGFGQILVTVLSAMVMTLLAWAWNLTQDVRVLMEARPQLATVEQILEGVRHGMEALANRLTKVEQVQVNRERDLAGLYKLVDDVNEAKAEVSALRATLRFLEGGDPGVHQYRVNRPPPER